MTCEEFSNEFDTLLQAYIKDAGFGSQQPIAFDEYEKSVFLTKAQENLIITLYNGKNSSGDSFENTEEIRRYLSNLVRTAVCDVDTEPHVRVSDESVFYKLPDDLWFITYESVTFADESSKCIDGRRIVVVPVTQDDYFRINNNPFRGSNIRRALRLDIENGVVEIIASHTIGAYIVRYVTKPSPIVVADLEEDVNVNGVNTVTECMLHPAIHRTILEEAVKLAVSTKSSK
jgi:hypothetical protein